MKTIKYSKSIDHYRETHADYFDDNDNLLSQKIIENKIYKSQQLRLACKVCGTKLSNKIDLSQFGVDYVFCNFCGHLNGIFEDSRHFVDSIYIEENGLEYNRILQDNNFIKRSEEIYVPKAKFLIDHLDCKSIDILDIGCGCGNFVYALLNLGINAKGIDVGGSSVAYGNNQIYGLIKTKPLEQCKENEFSEKIEQTNAKIISAIGVIEHLREPEKLFNSFLKSNAKYIYYSVPMFSLSSLIENIFPEVYPRQLSGAHTHLFTESSIEKMNELLKVKPIAEWRFGTDIMDLYRSVYVMLKKNGCSDNVTKLLESNFYSRLNTLQEVLDKSHFCSEIHVLAEKK